VDKAAVCGEKREPDHGAIATNGKINGRKNR
jgi:hypothetical protein